MSPTRYSNLFRNRWLALLWAGGICWSAVEFTSCMDVGPDNAVSADGNDAGDADLNRLEALVGELQKK